MKQHNKPQVQEQSFTPADYDKLRAGMNKYQQEKIDGLWHTKWHKYMEELGVIRYEKGEMFVLSPLAYKRFSDMNAKVEAFDDAKLEEIFAEFPEEKVAHQAKIAKVFEGISESLRRVYKDKKLASR